MPQRFPLNHQWRFILDDLPEYAQPGFDDSGWESVDIPHSMVELPLQYGARSNDFTIGWYRKPVTLPADRIGSRHRIRFEGVAHKATVWCDGVPAGTHEGSFTPFEFDLPPGSGACGHVLIAIRCDATEDPMLPPFGHVVDYIVPGGIYREVSLVSTLSASIENVFVRSEAVGKTTERLLRVRYTLVCDIEARYLELSVSVMDPGYVVLRTHRQAVEALGGELVIPLIDVRLWDIVEPVMHRIEITLFVNGQPYDSCSVSTGFRDVAFTSEGFLLNGRLVKLRGLNRHQLYPIVGFAMPKRQQYADADFLRYDLGLQVVRTSHYPQSTHFLDRCDQIGLLVMCELPGWQHIGKDRLWRESALRQLRDMIERDRNHPSIILWGVRINESADDDELYARTNELSRWLDPSRPTGGVRNFKRSHLLEDVYTYNDFSHDGSNTPLADSDAVSTDRAVPYLVTEHTGHMYPCRSSDPEWVRTEHALRHARVLDAMYARTRISGAIGWCMSDYQTNQEFGGGDGICYHGVSDMFRIPKLAAAVYASQQDDFPVMTISSQLAIGAHPAHAIGTVWVFTNCDCIELYFRGRHVGSYVPDQRNFGHLPHPPVAIQDLIGRRIDELQGFSSREKRLLRKVLNNAAHTGFDMPLIEKVRVGLLMHRHHLGKADAIQLFERFVLWWDDEEPLWEFRGMLGGKIALRKILEPPKDAHLVIESDQPILHEGDTYDVVRLVVSLRSGSDMVLWMSRSPVHVEISGPARLIGPADISLDGGQAGLYVRSVGCRGAVTVTISSTYYGEAVACLVVD